MSDASGFKGHATGAAVTTLGTVLREREKTKRLLIGAACLLFAIAALLAVFAPPAKQTLAYALGAALLVMALGAIGAARFKFKMPLVSVETLGDKDSEIRRMADNEFKM